MEVNEQAEVVVCGRVVVRDLVLLAATAALASTPAAPPGHDHQPPAPRRPRPSP